MSRTHDLSLLLSGQAVAQCSWYYSTTAPVRYWWTDVRYGSQELQRASDEVKLHSEVSAYDYYTNIDRGSQNTGLYLSESTPSYGVGESPNVRYIPVPVPVPVQQQQLMYQSQPQQFYPVQQPALQPAYAPVQAQSTPWPNQPSQPIHEGNRQPQPAQNNQLIPRDQSLLVNPEQRLPPVTPNVQPDTLPR